MVQRDEMRTGEVRTDLPAARDADLIFIGRIRTPWQDRLACPRQGRLDGPVCRIELAPPWNEALDGIEAYDRLEVLYWLDRSRRDLVRQSPRNDGATRGTFALRSPVRPNPIGTAVVRLVAREGSVLLVQGLDCLDGTPLLDLKPERGAFATPAPPQPGDAQLGGDAQVAGAEPAPTPVVYIRK